MLVFAEAAATLRAAADARIVLLGGASIDGQQHIWWNFVSSSKALIDEAKRNWQHGRFPKVPRGEGECIPLPE
jgi:redox-sensitive bicupin YhaK (pirin superfamily)